MKRDNLIDTMKGIGICLVVFGHNKSVVADYIYSFHMPLFFLISGVCFSKKDKFSIYIKKKTKTLLIPYFFNACILFSFWYVAGRKFGDSVKKNTSVSESFIGIFIGTDIKGLSSIEWGVPLWYLLCLFIINIIFYKIYSFKENRFIILGLNIFIVFIGMILSRNLLFRLPWSLLTAFIALPFYTFGFLYKEKILRKDVVKNKDLLVIFICFLLSTYFHKINGRVDMFNNSYNNIVYFYISAFFGSLFIINISKFCLNSKIIKYLGMNSLIIMIFHERVMTFIKFIIIIILQKEFKEGSIINSIVYTVFQILLCVPLIFIINNYIPILIGKIIKEDNLRKDKNLSCKI